MRSDYQGIAYNDGDEIEQRLAVIIGQVKDRSLHSVELCQHCTDWPSTYHLSKVRANILRPFEKEFQGKNILEMGAGCGALTRYLGEIGANVLALEGSVRRATITRLRTQELENVTVVADNISSFSINQQFDFVTLIGVLEYADLFISGETPAISLLKIARSFLKPNGRIIIAIENQLGLKYFAGAPEDHLGQAMIGIEGRYGKKQPRTFGQAVLGKMLKEADFIQQQFLAPFPDYKLPISIVTEQGMEEEHFDASVFAWQSVKSDEQLPLHTHFSLELAWQEAFKNRLGMSLSNSFLIVASLSEKSPLLPSTILAYHYSTRRTATYCKETTFNYSADGKIDICCMPLNGKKGEETSSLLVQHIFPRLERYVKGTLLSLKLIKILMADNWSISDVGTFLTQYTEILKKLLPFSDSSLRSPYNIISGSFFDAMPQNIILDKNQTPILFDQEWILNEPFEVGYLFFRVLFLITNAMTHFGFSKEGIITYHELIDNSLKRIGIPLKEADYHRYFQLELRIQAAISGVLEQERVKWNKEKLLPFRTASVEQQISQEVSLKKKDNTFCLKDCKLVASTSIQNAKKDCFSIGSFLLKKKKSITTPLFKFYNKLQTKNQYHHWVKQYDTWTALRHNKLLQKLNSPHSLISPTISILLPVYNPPLLFLKKAIESVQAQVWDKWELCIADDGSTDPKIREYLSAIAQADSRVKLLFSTRQRGISFATNQALSLASGDFVAFLDHDDVLAPHALGEVVLAIRDTPEVGLIYSDEDKMDEKGRRCDPFFKPDWNPDLLRSLNYCSHLSVIRRSLVLEVGGLDSTVDGAQDWDLVLRITEKLSADQIRHIPKILYHWRILPGSTARSAKAKPQIIQSGKILLDHHLQRTKRPFRSITKIHDGGHWRIEYKLPDPLPFVSIIIPTRNGYDLLKQCIESIETKTDYLYYEILIADNDSDDTAILNYFSEKEDGVKIRIVKTPGPFNYSFINNRAARQARGEVLVFLNNDIEVIEKGWLTELVSHAVRPEIGAVGGLLYYPDGKIQHAGVVLGIAGPMKVGGVAGHVGKYFFPHQPIAGNRLNVVQNFSAVTGACLAVRKKLYEEVGGFEEVHLPVSFNDVDFCLKLLAAGYLNLWTPFAVLVHHESATRGLEDTPEKIKRSHQEIEFMRQKWEKILDADPAYNPNLTLEHEDWSLAFPPRIT
ncbi:MAG: glycosyltransferase [Chthoniobacterales bacterium]|nr:glycosyltransferase [Chthoniobacterales bacterium]